VNQRTVDLTLKIVPWWSWKYGEKCF